MKLMMCLGCFAIDSCASAATDRKLSWSRSDIEFARKHFVDLIPENSKNPKDVAWLLGKVNNWEDCCRIYNNAVEMGWMTHADVEDWKAESAAPMFKDGVFRGIALKCGDGTDAT